MEAMENPDDDDEDGKDEEDSEKGEEDVERALEEAIERILERLSVEGEELEAVVLEHGDGVAEAVGEIAEDEETGAGALDGLDEGGGVFAKVDENDLRDAMAGDDAGKIGGEAENGALGRTAMGVGFIAQYADGAEAEARFAAEPRGDAGDAVAGADKEGVLLAHFAEREPEEETGEETVCPKEEDVEGGDKRDEEKTGDVSGVLCEEEEEEEGADGPDGLTKDDGEMIEDGALVENFADAAGTAEEMASEEAEDEGEAIGGVAGEIDHAKPRKEMDEEREPEPEKEDHGRALEGHEKRFNAANTL